ncbi:MAG: hypothetical protein V5783_03540 [Pontiella sp.]
MKKMITTTLAASLVASIATAGVSTTLDFASAYVFRGVTLNDGAVFQPGIEVSDFGLPEEYGAVSVGAWGNYDFEDYTPSGASSSTFQETDWYASYSLPAFVEGLDLFVGYGEYTYGAGVSDEEFSLGAGYEIVGIAVGLTYYQGVGGVISTSTYTELSLGYGFEFTEDFSAEVGARFGFLNPDDGESGFSDYDLSAGVGYVLSEKWSIGASVAYIGQGDDDVLADSTATDTGYDVDFVGSIGLACEM